MPIPTAEFIEDVDKYMQGQQVEAKLYELDQQLRSFKLQQQQLLTRRARLRDRLPQIKDALEAVLGLTAKQGSDEALLVDFELTENIYAKAALQHVDSVNIWLGANVMVEYPLPEAQQLLQEQLQACEGGLKGISKDLEAVKNNITITEVSMARVFNWDVENRRKLKAQRATAAAS